MSEENKKDYQENVDTLVTFGEEGHTMRKDDPRTNEMKSKLKEELGETLEKGVKSGEISLWEGIDLSNKRAEGEEYADYKERLKTIKMLQKLYRQLGIEECKKQFPMGFAYAINEAVQSGDKTIAKPASQPKIVANIDGKEIPVIIKND